MTFTEFSSGVNTSFSSQLNSNFAPLQILRVYTGSGWDCVASGATTSSTTTLTVASSSIDNATYVVVDVSFYGHLTVSTTSSAAHVGLQIATAEIGSTTFSDLLPATYFLSDKSASAAPSTYELRDCGSVRLFHTLTAGQKTNGLQIKLYGLFYQEAGSGGGSVHNIQTVVGLWY